MSKSHINRPWTTSFPFHMARFNETSLEQIYKLCRNFVASLDLGCPSVKHVELIGIQRTTKGMTEREKYLEWVRDWKYLYARVSELIRHMKVSRRTIRFPSPTPEEEEAWLRASAGTNLSMCQYMNSVSHRHLGRLQETAQVLLNARYNAKLAAGARRAMARERNGNAPDSNPGDAGSTPAEPADDLTLSPQGLVRVV